MSFRTPTFFAGKIPATPDTAKIATKLATPINAKNAPKPAESGDLRSEEEKAAVASLFPVVGEILTNMAKTNTPPHIKCLKDLEKSERITSFHAIKIPSMSIADYLTRLVNYLDLTEDSLLHMLIYIDRVFEAPCNLRFSTYTAHRIILTSLLIAVKFINDHYYNNAFFAEVGGVPTNELNKLEVDFLQGIGFNLYALDCKDDKTTGIITQYREELKTYQQQMQEQQNQLPSQPICKLL